MEGVSVSRDKVFFFFARGRFRLGQEGLVGGEGEGWVEVGAHRNHLDFLC